MIRLVTFSTLYPNAVRPNHGIFVETRLRHLLASGVVQSHVIAPVPWFPFRHRKFGRYGEHARVSSRDERFGVDIRHPRYLSVPKIGMNMAPKLLAQAARPSFERLREEGYDFDAIDAHYFYPDGVAAAMLSLQLKRPVVITARGSDINLIAEFPRPRAMIRRAAEQASALITVSRALKDKLVELGAEANKIRVLRNGVDLECFHPVDRAAARNHLGLHDGPILASVGNLVPEKGHDLVIEALRSLPRVHLVIVGSGGQHSALRACAERFGVADRVRFLGLLSQSELVQVYGAANLLVLASSREGWANVLLESLACGTPVVATDVGAAAEAIRAAEAGKVVATRTAQAIADVVRGLLNEPPERSATRRYAEQFSWDETTRGQIDLFNAIVQRPAGVQYSQAA